MSLVAHCDRCAVILSDGGWAGGWVSEAVEGTAERIWHINIFHNDADTYLCKGCRHAILQLAINALLAKVPDRLTRTVLHTPWTEQHIAHLNQYQRAGRFHPYTCGNDSRHQVLVATPDGWMCPDCDYRQDWAHALPLLTEEE